jgi:hypothetical protein
MLKTVAAWTVAFGFMGLLLAWAAHLSDSLTIGLVLIAAIAGAWLCKEPLDFYFAAPAVVLALPCTWLFKLGLPGWMSVLAGLAVGAAITFVVVVELVAWMAKDMLYELRVAKQRAFGILHSRPLWMALFYAVLFDLVALAAGADMADLKAVPVAGVVFGLAAGSNRRHWTLSYTLVGSLIGLFLAALEGGGTQSKLTWGILFALGGALAGEREYRLHLDGQREWERRFAGDDLDGTWLDRRDEQAPEAPSVLA